jgi:hypothetical protein
MARDSVFHFTFLRVFAGKGERFEYGAGATAFDPQKPQRGVSEGREEERLGQLLNEARTV